MHQTMLEIASVSQDILESSAVDVLLVTMDIHLASVSNYCDSFCFQCDRFCSCCSTGMCLRDILLYV